jgi:hypothetical protein
MEDGAPARRQAPVSACRTVAPFGQRTDATNNAKSNLECPVWPGMGERLAATARIDPVKISSRCL